MSEHCSLQDDMVSTSLQSALSSGQGVSCRPNLTDSPLSFPIGHRSLDLLDLRIQYHGAKSSSFESTGLHGAAHKRILIEDESHAEIPMNC